MQKDNQEDLDLEYVQFNVSRVLSLLNKRFARKKGCNTLSADLPTLPLKKEGRAKPPLQRK
ncbi:hypothetical protein HCDG_02319 [Histoplasma capsulatum H143]|uniref:Uncharacterized protein n=1 Tax=Ajellomyces capsulatus (strain H143) TaxID=544712 RepID=C6H7B8_AJECH|nr:hypothetical protein HCDG_02319 [Histoplasma capsulatum H143]